MPITHISTNPTMKNKQRKRGWVHNNQGELLPLEWPLQGHVALFSLVKALRNTALDRHLSSE